MSKENWRDRMKNATEITSNYLSLGEVAWEQDKHEFSNRLSKFSGYAAHPKEFTCDRACAQVGYLIASLEDEKEIARGCNIVMQDGVRIVDARKATSHIPDPNPYPWQQQTLNLIRAALQLTELEDEFDGSDADKVALQRQLYEYARRYMHDTMNGFDAQDLRARAVGDLESMLKKAGIKSPVKKLDTLKDFQNFEDTHLTTVTISSKVHGPLTDAIYNVVEIDAPIMRLSQEQRDNFELICGVSVPFNIPVFSRMK